MSEIATQMPEARAPTMAQPRPKDSEARSLKMAVGLYAAIFAAKLAVYFVTGVMVLLAEALHTLSDIFIAGFLLVALLYSRKRADQAHMFGHGRAQSVAGLVAAVLFISFTAYKLYEEAIPRLFTPAEARYKNLWLAIVVLVASALVAAIPAWGLLRAKRRGAAAKAQLLNLVNDELGLVAALAATVLVLWGWPLADPIASIVVASIIAINGIYLFRENFSMLLGQAPPPAFMERIRSEALSVPGVSGVHGVLAEVVGPDSVHAGIRLAVPPEMPVSEAQRLAERVRERMHDKANAGYCVIQLEAATAADLSPKVPVTEQKDLTPVTLRR